MSEGNVAFIKEEGYNNVNTPKLAGKIMFSIDTLLFGSLVTRDAPRRLFVPLSVSPGRRGTLSGIKKPYFYSEFISVLSSIKYKCFCQIQ